MKKKILFFYLFILINQLALAQTKTLSNLSLTAKERAIVTISANAVQGNMPKLTIALNNGLNAGLSISEIKEMLVQLYAYAGFPRSLNALQNLMAVLEERKKKGIGDIAGKEPSLHIVGKTMLQTGTENQTKLTGRTFSGGVFAFAPAIDQFLKEHLFGAIFSRNNLDWKTRELVTISALAAMEGVESQLSSHYNVGMYNGLSSAQLSELVTIIESDVSKQQAVVAQRVLTSILDKTTYTSATIDDKAMLPKGQKINNDNFTGNAWLHQMVTPDSLNPTQVGSVTFDPGARTKWHLHPGGQILIIISGTGYYQEKGSRKRLLKKGDVIKCPANLPHWHGGSKEEELVQIAITNTQYGAPVWLEPVSENEYQEAL